MRGGREAVPLARIREHDHFAAMAIQETQLPPVPEVSPELPPASSRLLLSVLRRLPQGALSRAFGALADVPLPRPLRRPVLGSFARAVGADLAEAELPLDAYPTLNRFFTRKLRPGVRSFPDDADIVASPVDGTLGQMGRIDGGRIVQAKGRRYSAAALLQDEIGAARYTGGAFVTLYLSPRDYHHIHAPTGGRIHSATHVPGALLPVNAPAVAHIPDLFTRNERLVCYLDGPLGRVAVVAVGAYNVGRISASFDPVWNAPSGSSAWVTNRRVMQPATRRYDPPVRLRQGDNLMTFHLGSTVVLLFEPGRVELASSLAPGTTVRLGQAIARAP
jgi:phosphatidylserine decarboxylase